MSDEDLEKWQKRRNGVARELVPFIALFTGMAVHFTWHNWVFTIAAFVAGVYLPVLKYKRERNASLRACNAAGIEVPDSSNWRGVATAE